MMPRDIITTVLQMNSADILVAEEQQRFQNILAAVGTDKPIFLHYRWKIRTVCCICASTDVSSTVKYIDFSVNTGNLCRLSTCSTCVRTLKLNQKERMFVEPSGTSFVGF